MSGVLNSRTSLHTANHIHYHNPTPMFSLSAVKAHSPKSVNRTTFRALFSLIALSTYFFFVAKPTVSLSQFAVHDSPAPVNNNNGFHSIFSSHSHIPPTLARHKKLQKIHAVQAHNAQRPQLQLNQSQELAAVTSFLASLPQNVIPPTVDPTHQIDPQLVLDFDTRSGDRAEQELHELVDDVWARNPVVLYSKVRSIPHIQF